MKKTNILLLVLAVSFVSNLAFGQVYEKVYELSGPQVQNKMNQNKINGVAILSGVDAHQVIGLSGIGAAQKTELENLLASDSRISSTIVSADATSVILDSNAAFTKEEFLILIQPLNATVTGYSVTYSVQD